MPPSDGQRSGASFPLQFVLISSTKDRRGATIRLVQNWLIGFILPTLH